MKKFMNFIWVLAIAVVFLFQGCKVAQISEEVDATNIPVAYGASQGDSTANPGLVQWTAYFEDPQLQKLIQVALENNQDNLKTLERIRIARSQMQMARMALLPEVNGVAGAARRKFGEYTMDGVGNLDSNLSSTVPEDKRIPDPYRDFLVGMEFSWEVDIWGKLRSEKRAAALRFMASEEMASNVKTWLISEVASTYYTLVSLDEELRILNENIRLQELAFNYSRDLKEAGKENQLAVDQFEALLLNSKALLAEKLLLLRSAELQLSSLLGIYELDHQRISLSQINALPHVLEIGIPDQLLTLRPDIRAAERELLATKADVAAARAAFFPGLRISGMAGYNAFDFSKLFFSPASTAWQLGAGLTAPVFNRRRISLEYEMANSRQRIAWLDYEQTVFKSYLEVLDLVNQYENLEKQIGFKDEEVAVQKRSVDNSNTMFSVGYATYLEVINAQSRALISQIEFVELRRRQLETRVRLYRALGGGWR